MNDFFENRVDAKQMRRRLFADEPSRFTLENGLTVLHREEDAAELVTLQLWVRTGSIHEGALLGTGVSHYLEHMAFKRTARRVDGQVAREVQERGGSINAYTSFDRTVYYVDLPSEHAAFGAELLADMVFAPALDEGEVRKERDVILREIDMGLDDPDYKVSRALFETAFRAHPYRLPVIGKRSLFERLTAEDLRAYHTERYDPANATLVVVGQVSAEALRESLQEHYAGLPNRSHAPVLIPEEPAQLATRVQRLAADVAMCRGMFAYRIPGLSHRDAPALDLLAAGLGQGRSSHLYRTLRDARELLHDVSVHAWNPGTRGLLWISYLCDPGKRPAVEAAILSELERVCDKGLEALALEKARRSALVSEVNSRKTVSGQAARIGLAEVVVGDLGYPRAYHEALEKVSLEEIREVARRYLVRDQLTQVSVNQVQAEAPSRVTVPKALPAGDFEMKTLANGARLVWQADRRLPKVNLRFLALGGAHYEDPAERGITGLLSTLLTRDTAARTHSEVAEAIEKVGGVFSEFAGNNSFGLSLEVLTPDLHLARSLLQDCVLAPRFQPEVFARERASMIAAVKERWDDNVERAHLLLRRHFFGSHPLAIDGGGTQETLEAIQLDALRTYFARMVTAGNSVLVLAGDFDPDRELPFFEALLQDLPTWHFTPQEVPFSPGGGGAFEAYAPREQAVVLLAFPDVGVRSREDLCGQIVNAACADMASALFRTVRDERNLAYFVSAQRVLS
ncbi:MAG: M16 family metallopeptidase, partial [Opitutales bacterium]